MSQQTERSDEEMERRLGDYVGRRYGAIRAWDRVNAPMIRQWAEALDYNYPLLDSEAAKASRHGELVAPASMLQVWLMPGLKNARPAGSDLSDPRELFKILEEYGYIGIIATDCEQEYFRPLKVGELITTSTLVEKVSDRKSTRLGPGYFTTFLQEYHDEQGGLVGTMRLRILRYRPEGRTADAKKDRPAPPQPGISQDTAQFWEGLKENKLLIQKCSRCETLIHPPEPVCRNCQSLELGTIEASGKGEVFSFVVSHHPKVAAFDYPHPIGLIELEEGVRMVAPLTGVDPAKIEIGMKVVVEFDNVEGQNRLPKFRPA
ncbi:MAG: bifunctional MaoC family dehydratase N-terminal/OB-fold nucleic acid binding domain-containing protein [Flavobacteriaceae bacterium]